MQINLFPDLSLLAVLVIFWLNYLVVKRYFFKPINEILDAREADTKTAETLYQESLERFNEATAKMEEELHLAKRNAAQVRERFRADAAAYRARVLLETQRQAKGLASEAESKLKRDVTEARATIERASDSLARLAAERILGRAV